MGPTETPGAMMSFKAFLAAQDDSITVDDAIQKYNEYKLEYRRQQLNEFFVAHKDEEWCVLCLFLHIFSFPKENYLAFHFEHSSMFFL